MRSHGEDDGLPEGLEDSGYIGSYTPSKPSQPWDQIVLDGEWSREELEKLVVWMKTRAAAAVLSKL